MKRRNIVTALSAIAVVVGSVVVASPASALTCSSGSACSWGDSQYKTAGGEGNQVAFRYYIPNYSGWTYNGNGNANDSASSVYNNGNTDTVYWYDDSSARTYAFRMATKNGDQNLNDALGTAPAGHNDKLSSGYFTSCLSGSAC